ncbi:MAG: hypothetical protein ABI697_12740 [Devosia sp.]
MPVKRRAGKRRVDPQAEIMAWSGLFRCGYDFFGELEPWGFGGRADPTDTEARMAAPTVWARLGPSFMDWFDEGRRGSLPHATGDNGEPWALTEFGDPRNGR